MSRTTCLARVHHLVRHLASVTTALACLGAATLLLAGCEGGDAAPDVEVTSAPPATARPAEVMSAEPSDPGARTRQGRYLTREQAQALARQVDYRLVNVVAHCCSLHESETDVGIALGMQAADDLPNDAPFVVSGSDLRQAAAVANRLGELGATRVYLVTR